MKKKKVDVIDIAILNLLMVDNWRSNKEISEALELSQPATLVRVQNLRKRGFISNRGIQIDVTKFGYNLEAGYLIQYLKRDEQTIIDRVNNARLVTSCIILKGTDLFAFNWLYFKVVGRNPIDIEVASKMVLEDLEVFYFNQFDSIREVKCNEFSLQESDVVK